MRHVLVNTNLAAAAGVVAALAVSRPIMGRTDLFVGLNGAIAGLVSITAGPDIVEHYWAIVIGAVGAILCTAGLKLLEKLKARRRGWGRSRPPHRGHLGNLGGLDCRRRHVPRSG